MAGKKKPVGWRGEPVRHSKAARGIKTATVKQKPVPERLDSQMRAAAQEVEDKARRLEEIQGEMDDLLEEAFRLLRGTDEQESARGYWYAHIKGALDKDESGFLGGSMIDMQQTIEGLESEASDLRIEAAGPGEGGIIRAMIVELEKYDSGHTYMAINQLRRFLDSGNQEALRKAIEHVDNEAEDDLRSRRERERLTDMAMALDDMQVSE